MLVVTSSIPTQVSVPAGARAQVFATFSASDNDPLLANAAVQVTISWGDASPAQVFGPTPGGVSVSNLAHSFSQGTYFVTVTAQNYRAPVPDVDTQVTQLTVSGPPPVAGVPAPVIIGPILPRDDGYPGPDEWNFNVGQDLVLLASDLKLLLTTSIGERLMLPTYGTALRSLIFGQDPRALLTLVQSEIETAIATWEPRVSLVSVNATQQGTSVTIDAVFLSKLNQQLINTSLTFSSS
jgi:phage baseplate assembly protein W